MSEKLRAKPGPGRNPDTKRMGRRQPLLSLCIRRTAALLTDWLLATLVFGSVLWLVFGTESFRTGDGTYHIAVPAILYAIYLLGFWLWRATTPGMMLFGIRVIDLNTRDTPLPWQWWMRGLGFMVAAIPLGLGFIWALWDERGRAWHDHVAGTIVVNT